MYCPFRQYIWKYGQKLKFEPDEFTGSDQMTKFGGRTKARGASAFDCGDLHAVVSGFVVHFKVARVHRLHLSCTTRTFAIFLQIVDGKEAKLKALKFGLLVRCERVRRLLQMAQHDRLLLRQQQFRLYFAIRASRVVFRLLLN